MEYESKPSSLCCRAPIAEQWINESSKYVCSACGAILKPDGFLNSGKISEEPPINLFDNSVKIDLIKKEK